MRDQGFTVTSPIAETPRHGHKSLGGSGDINNDAIRYGASPLVAFRLDTR